MDAKYIIIQGHDGLEYPFIFSPLINHKDFARTFEFKGKVVGAGFVSMGENSFTCYGQSISLGIESCSEDIEIFNRCFKRI